MSTKSVPLLNLFLFFAGFAYGQDQTESARSEVPKPYLKVSMEYQNNSVYLGRKDSLAIAYLTPQFHYHFKSGLFFDAGISFLPAENRADVSTIGAGYAFTRKKWDGDFSAEKYFYNSQSYNVKAETKGSIMGSLSYDAAYVEPSLSGFINFGGKDDYGASFSLEHYFSFFRDHANISPSFVVNAGTQNSYARYYEKRKYVKTRKGKTLGYTTIANTLNTSNFKLLDYEFSLPMEFAAKRFTFSFTPSYAVPVNPATVVLTIQTAGGSTLTKSFTENLSNSYYWTVGVAYKINGK